MKNTIKMITKYEGKLHEASVGDVREVLKILAIIVAAEIEVNRSFEPEFDAYSNKYAKKIRNRKKPFNSVTEAVEYFTKEKK